MMRKPLNIGELTAKFPLIQGGMGVGISLSGLAGAVAKEGGIGIISTAQIGFREPDFDTSPIQANLRAMGKELKKARMRAPHGIIGFNIMVATKKYEEYVKEAVKNGADLIISGAGLPVELPGLVAGFKTKIAPIVSSVKAAGVICRLWDKKYHVAPDMVVIEGPKAGGHLGFTEEQAKQAETLNYDNEIKGIIEKVKEYACKYQKKIPVIIAGGIYDKKDVAHAIDELGADGVQVATRFVTTEECDASQEYKDTYLNAKKKDIIIIKSPVGMPGRAIRNSFLERVEEGPVRTKKCHLCIEPCVPSQTPYCITDALINAAIGKVDDALLFCGLNAWRSDKIETVHDIVQELMTV